MADWAIFLIVALVLVPTLMVIADYLKKIIARIIAAPGKGFKKVFNYAKNRKTISLDNKLNKALLEADEAARLNAARQNPNYKNHPKVKKIIAKKDYKASKKIK